MGTDWLAPTLCSPQQKDGTGVHSEQGAGEPKAPLRFEGLPPTSF